MHRPWSELAAHYVESAKLQPKWARTHLAMAKLCSDIGFSELSESLFGHTSHHSLRIAQQAVLYPPHHSIQWLVLNPLLEEDKVEFRFEDTQLKQDQWSRVESLDGLLDRMNGFLRQVGWSYTAIESQSI